MDAAGERSVEGFGVVGATDSAGFADTAGASVLESCPFKAPGFSPPTSSAVGPSVEPFQLKPFVGTAGKAGRGIEDEDMKYSIMTPLKVNT